MDSRIKSVIEFMEENLHRRLSLTTMSLVAGLSSSRLRHKFKDETGFTPTVYLENLRMKKAAVLLNNYRLRIKEVRAAVGIESDSYFTHRFSQTYGAAPSQVRALL